LIPFRGETEEPGSPDDKIQNHETILKESKIN